MPHLTFCSRVFDDFHGAFKVLKSFSCLKGVFSNLYSFISICLFPLHIESFVKLISFMSRYSSLGIAHFRRQTEVALEKVTSLGTSVGGLN